MAYAPIAFTLPQYEDYPNWWMKAYEQGTTTPLSIATDATGGTLAAKIELNVDGFPVTAGAVRFIPFINGDYDLWLFPTAAEADANDTTNAIQLADNINADAASNVSPSDISAPTVVDNIVALVATSPAAGNVYETRYYSTRANGGGGRYLAKTSAQAVADGDTVDEIGLGFTAANGNIFVLLHDGVVSARQFGAESGASDQATKILAALDTGLVVDGGGYTFTANSVTTTATTVQLRNIKLVECSTFNLDSATTELVLDDVHVDGGWDGLSPVDFSLRDALVTAEHVSETGVLKVNKLEVSNYNGSGVLFKKFAEVVGSDLYVHDCAYGSEIRDNNHVIWDGIRVRDVRRIGVTFQSESNTPDHDDLNVTNISIENVLPGIGTGGSLHGIGVEIHNFVDQALVSNVRVRNAHSMGLSLSGAEYSRVTNLFIRDIGYTSESAAETTQRGYAAVEIVDSDGAFVEGSVIDCYQTVVRFDKTHYGAVNMKCEQNNTTVDASNFRFVRFQGTASDFNNAAWSCEVHGDYRNNTSTKLEFLDVGTFGTYLQYRHLVDCKVFNAVVDGAGLFDYNGLVIESDGTFDNSTTGVVDSLLDVVDAGGDIQLKNIQYIGLDAASKPKGFCRISSGSINALTVEGCTLRNIENIITAASGTLAEAGINNNTLDNVDGLYSGTVSSAFRVLGSSNTEINGTSIAELPRIRHGNSISGVSGKDGDQLWKNNFTSGVSPGWLHDGTTWQPITSTLI